MLRNFFTKDSGWKLFSLVLAVAIWVTVHRILTETGVPAPSDLGDTVTYGDLSVQVVSASADVHDFRVAPTTVKVTLSGPDEIMDKLQADKVHAVVDLTGFQLDGDMHCPVDVTAPPHVTVISVDPPKVAVIPPPPKR